MRRRTLFPPPFFCCRKLRKMLFFIYECKFLFFCGGADCGGIPDCRLRRALAASRKFVGTGNVALFCVLRNFSCGIFRFGFRCRRKMRIHRALRHAAFAASVLVRVVAVFDFLRPVLCRFFGECQSFKNRCLQRRFRAAFGQIRRVGRKLSVRLHRILRRRKYRRRRKGVFLPQDNSAIFCGRRLVCAGAARVVSTCDSSAFFGRNAEMRRYFSDGQF